MEPETGGDPERQENIDGSDQLSAAAEEPVARDSTETPNTEGRLETNGTDVISPDDSASTPRAVPQQLHGTASDSLVTPQRESDTDTLDFSIDASPSHFSAAPSRDLVVLVVHCKEPGFASKAMDAIRRIQRVFDRSLRLQRQSDLVKTGNFEIYVNDKLVHSRQTLNDGFLDDAHKCERLFCEIEKAGGRRAERRQSRTPTKDVQCTCVLM